MNFVSKNKKRMVLPVRPELLSVEQIMEDVNRSHPNDPVLTVLQHSAEDMKSSSSEVETRYQQSRHYIGLHEKLQDACGSLAQRRLDLCAAGESLDCAVMSVKTNTH